MLTKKHFENAATQIARIAYEVSDNQSLQGHHAHAMICLICAINDNPKFDKDYFREAVATRLLALNKKYEA